MVLTAHVAPWHWANCRYMSNPISPQETEITNALANALVAMGQRTDALHTKVTAFLRPAPVPCRYHACAAGGNWRANRLPLYFTSYDSRRVSALPFPHPLVTVPKQGFHLASLR